MVGVDLNISAEVLDFHGQLFVMDGVALSYVLDEPYTERVLSGGVNACIVTVAAEEDWGRVPLWEATLRLVEAALRKIEDNPSMTLATCAADLLEAQRQGKLGVVMGFQSASMIGRDFWRLKLLHELGLRCLQLTFTFANLYGDGNGERRNAGLSLLGVEFVQAVNEYRMLLDLSHCGERTALDAIEHATAPVCTHANAYTLNPTAMCKTDEAVKAMVAKGGMIGVQCWPRALNSQHPETVTIDDVIDHVDHFVKLVGLKNVGFGLGFTEGLREQNRLFNESKRMYTLRPDIYGDVRDFVEMSYPRGLESIRLLPNLTQRLLDRGYAQDELGGLLGGNWLRVLHSAIG